MKRVCFLLIIMLVTTLFMGCDDDSTAVNIVPELPNSPNPADGSTNLDIVVELQWSCADEDGDDLTYTVFMGTTTSLDTIAADLTATSFTTETLDYDQEYYWRIRANDGKDTTIGSRWYFETMAEDIPPTQPVNPIPANGSTDVDLNQHFYWYCFDVDGDEMSYDFYLDTEADPQLWAQDLPAEEITVTELEGHTMYYWKIIAKSKDLTTEGPIWCFETEYGNCLPDLPNDPSPQDGANDISINTELTWDCSDPEGDDLTYDIYLGTDPDPQLEIEGCDDLSYEPADLEPSTIYYWRIAVHDAENCVEGPIWQFTTGAPNDPPNAPHMPRPTDEAENESVYAMLRWSCSDPDGDDLMYKVYFGDVPILTEDEMIGIGLTDENIDLGMLEFNTTYYWKIIAHDGELATEGDTWSFTTEISN